MRSIERSWLTTTTRAAWLGALGLSLALAACSGDDGDTGPAGPQGPPGDGGGTSTALEQGDDIPGIDLQIVGLSGGTGPGGAFKVGDKPKVTFTCKKTDGTDWDLSEMYRGRIYLDGPTFNYQRVIAEQQDVLTASVQNADGSYTYSYATAIPSAYLAPLNDSAAFDEDDGELTGQPLLSGTYTVAMYVSWQYTVDGATKRDAGNAWMDFLFGSATTIEPREVVTTANCNACHETLQAHGGQRREVVLCLMCHSSGAQDRQTTNPTSIDFRVMIHKLHNAAHLPSVNGVATNPDGSRNYAATPMPYLIGDEGDADDFSEIVFPVWPSLNIGMPRDLGYTALSSGAKTQENTILLGVVSCEKCHGDPDGAGALPAPAQGDLYKEQPSEKACGSCHDDIAWGSPYTANNQTMPGTANNSNCLLCHPADGVPGPGLLPTGLAHTHPLLEPSFNTGVNIEITAVAEGGVAGVDNDDDGTIDPGETVELTFTIEDDMGAAITPATLGNTLSAVFSGPTNNLNLLLSGSIPTAALSGAQPYVINLPEARTLEYVGDATGAAGDVFTTARAPHWNVTSATTTVFVRTATAGGSSTLAADAEVPTNYVDVASAAGFARDDYVVIEDGVMGLEEYNRISYVDGTRLWLQTSGTAFAHAAGATIKEVTLTQKAVTTDYTLAAATGAITEVTEFGAGNAVIVSYTSDFVMPGVYPLPINASPDLDESIGKWTGKPIADGTYRLGIWGAVSKNFTVPGAPAESTSYRLTSTTNAVDVLVGSATDEEPYALISSGDTCYACHSDLFFHGGGRRGIDACILCHGTVGSEDRAQYTAANAPATTGLTINFRTMLHKIHMGAELANADSYTVVGFGSAAYPNNFGTSGYGEVEFPDMPGGARDCAKCHGTSDSWQEPADRSHPTDQVDPMRRWLPVCGSCHDSDDAQAHIEVQTTAGGAESCGVCHGDGKEWSVTRMHKAY